MRIRRELSDRLSRLSPGPQLPARDVIPIVLEAETAGDQPPVLVHTGDPQVVPTVGHESNAVGDVAHDGAELHHAVLAVLRPAILVGDLPPGIRLIEEEVAAHLGVSRGPVREALGILRDEGLVTTAARRGAVVVGLTPQDIDDLYDLRIVLECHAIRRATANVRDADIEYLRGLDAGMVALARIETVASPDVAFHRHLILLARQERLRSAWERIAGIVGGLLSVTDGQRPDLVLHSHLIDALASGDGDTASAILNVHIRNAHRIMRGVLSSRSESGAR